MLLCTQVKTFDRQKKLEATLNIVWVPYVVSETVLSEVLKFNMKSSAKIFAIAAINDFKVSIEEAVQTFKSLGNLSKLNGSLKPNKNLAMQPEFSCTF